MEGPAQVLLLDLLDGITPLDLAGDPTVDVRALEHDSRRVGPGSCFACLPGTHTDGHDHAPEAIAAGAVALLVERPLGLGVSEARVSDVRRVLGPVAARLHHEPSHALRCLGVTGTNAKTSTTYLLEAIAIAAGETAGLVGTTGARIADESIAIDFTTPEATELQALLARMRDVGVHTVALEVSSHALAQHRVDGTWFAAACFTNLSHDHLDFHHDVDAYFAAKLRLFEPERCGVAVTNVDNPYGRAVAAHARERGLGVFTYALDDPAADVGAESIQVEADGSRFVLVDRRAGGRIDVHLPLLGRINVANALAAAAVERATGGSLTRIANGLAHAPVIPGRLERVGTGQAFSVLVDYAHTPDALMHAIRTARDLAGASRVAVVFGCGGDRDIEKRPAMGAAAAAADFVVVTSDNPRSEDPARIAEAARAGVVAAGGTPLIELDRRAAMRAAFEWAAPGDVVLVAGKGHESGQTTGDRTIPFDDRVVAREEIEGLTCA